MLYSEAVRIALAFGARTCNINHRPLRVYASKAKGKNAHNNNQCYLSSILKYSF